MLSPVVLVLLCLATAGITRALVIEKPFGWWRRWVQSWSGEEGNFTYLVNCPFCTGFWVGFVLTAVTWVDLRYVTPANSTWLLCLIPWAIFAVAPHIADR